MLSMASKTSLTTRGNDMLETIRQQLEALRDQLSLQAPNSQRTQKITCELSNAICYVSRAIDSIEAE